MTKHDEAMAALGSSETATHLHTKIERGLIMDPDVFRKHCYHREFHAGLRELAQKNFEEKNLLLARWLPKKRGARQ